MKIGGTCILTNNSTLLRKKIQSAKTIDEETNREITKSLSRFDIPIRSVNISRR